MNPKYAPLFQPWQVGKVTIKKKTKKGMKEIRALLDKKTRDPLQLRIKVAFIWANVDISDFKAGGITDATFTFPRSQYKDYEFIDKRKD